MKTCNSKAYAFTATVFISTFVSVLSYEFFPTYISKGYFELFPNGPDFWLNQWLGFSNFMNPIVDLTRTTTVSFGYLLSTLLLFLIPRQSDYHKNFTYYLTIFCFAVYSTLTYPASFYVMVIGYSIYSGFSIIKKWILNPEKQSFLQWSVLENFKFIFIAVLAKFLSLSQSATTINDVQTIAWQPRLTWVPSFHQFLFNIYSLDELVNFPRIYDLRAGKNYYQFDFFSWLSFRGFLLLILIAAILLIINRKNRQGQTIAISCFFAASFSVCLPCLFHYTLSPVEIDRFFVVSVFFSFLSILISTSSIFMKSPRIVKLSITLILLAFNMPGLAYYFPFGNDDFKGTLLNPDQKIALKILDKIQESGQRILARTPGNTPGYDLIGLSGFFQTGGEIYKADLYTQQTAFATLDYKLLNELKVDYILYGPANPKSDFENSKLTNSKVFEPITDISQKTNMKYQLYKYHKQIPEKSRQDYAWVLGYQEGGNFNFHILPIGNEIKIGAKRDKMELLFKKMKEKMPKRPDGVKGLSNVSTASYINIMTYVRPQAFSLEALKLLKENRKVSLDDFKTPDL